MKRTRVPAAPPSAAPVGTAERVAHKALRGAAWVVGLGWGSRILSLGGTLALTFFLDRQTLGEVSGAAILVGTANQLSALAVPSYLATRATLSEQARWTAVVTYAALGVLALSLVTALAGPLGQAASAPRLAVYAPGLALAAYLMRMSAIPEVMLQRQLRFRAASGWKALADIAYSASSVALAVRGLGGHAVVLGGILRGAMLVGLLSWSATPRSWAMPATFSRPELRRLVSFGVPLTFGMAGNVIVRQWDNWLILGHFGPQTAGAYGQAYNLADVPAAQVTEQVGDVAAPSFAKLDLAQKKGALVRLLSGVALVVFPLSVGLSVVAPTFVALLRPEWASMGPLLSVLALFALVRPLGWTVSVYLQTTDRPRWVMWLMLMLIAVLFPAMGLLGHVFGPTGACAGVVLAFAVHAAGSVVLVARRDAMSVGRMLGGPLRVLVACTPLALFALCARAAATETGIAAGALRLSIEVLAGVLGYAIGIGLCARPVVRDLLAVVRTARQNRGDEERPTS